MLGKSKIGEHQAPSKTTIRRDIYKKPLMCLTSVSGMLDATTSAANAWEAFVPWSCHQPKKTHHMVEPQGVYAAEFNGAADGLANDGGAQVAHVHLLCNIWRREVHNCALVRQHGRPRLDALHPSDAVTGKSKGVITSSTLYLAYVTDGDEMSVPLERFLPMPSRLLWTERRVCNITCNWQLVCSGESIPA